MSVSNHYYKKLPGKQNHVILMSFLVLECLKDASRKVNHDGYAPNFWTVQDIVFKHISDKVSM